MELTPPAFQFDEKDAWLTLTAKFNLVFQYFIESTPCDFAENATAENIRDNRVAWSEYDFIVQGF